MAKCLCIWYAVGHLPCQNLSTAVMFVDTEVKSLGTTNITVYAHYTQDI